MNPLLRLLPLWLLFVVSWVGRAQTYFPVPPAVPNAVSSNSRGPNGSVDFHRTCFIYTAADMAQGAIPAGTSVNSIGFHIVTPAAQAATGTFRLWVSRPVLDPAYARSTTWTTLLTTPSAMTKVYDGPLTIPAQAGWYDVVFNQPGVSLNLAAGAGYYIAYEWEAATKSATSAEYRCFNLTNTLNTATGTTAPAVLSNNSGFRPWIRFGSTGGVSYPDAGVLGVYSLAQLPLLNGAALPHRVRALVTNGGTQVLHNLPVRLDITGPNPFTNTVMLDSIRPGDTTWVRFAGYVPTVPGHHGLRVSVPTVNDSISNNNEVTDSLRVVADRLTYAPGNPPGNAPFFTFPVGFDINAGAMLVRHVARTPVAVSHVGFSIGNRPYNVGKTVFAVLLDSAGQLLTPLVPHTILATELGEYVRVPLPTPVLVRGSFFAGLGQPAGGAGQAYYPLGAQEELPVTRDSAYYSIPGDLLLLGQTPPRQIRHLGRFVIGVDLVPGPTGLPDASISDGQLAVWPNPAGEWVRVEGWPGAAPVRLTLRDALGRIVLMRTTTEPITTLELNHLSKGLYQLTATHVSTGLVYGRQRLVVQ